MSKIETIEINGMKITIQSAPIETYWDIYDRFKDETFKYQDKLIRTYVAQPPEIRQKGLKYFDENFAFAEKVVKEVHRFLNTPHKLTAGAGESAGA